jgi:hypothetical protein
MQQEFEDKTAKTSKQAKPSFCQAANPQGPGKCDFPGSGFSQSNTGRNELHGESNPK